MTAARKHLFRALRHLKLCAMRIRNGEQHDALLEAMRTMAALRMAELTEKKQERSHDGR